MGPSTKKDEPTRPVTSYETHEGNLRAISLLSPRSISTRAAVKVPPNKVMPVIVVAGIMGSNLRSCSNPSSGKENSQLKPGTPVWRPPNGLEQGLSEARKWKNLSPAIRQEILDGDALEVDPDGPIPLGGATDGFVWDEKIAKERGWGEIHAGSYGLLLVTLQQNLNRTYRSVNGNFMLEENWIALNHVSRSNWGITNEGLGAPLTDVELKKFAEFSYPVYAFGYNWLKCNSLSAQALQVRIEKIIAYWKSLKRECDAVILVTHSMGGLVARACCQKIPDRIAGVIHGVMPALGAPACYRRLACGTETSSPSNSAAENKAAEKFAEIAGLTVSETTPVLAVAAGALELLPTHLYPVPWLFAQAVDAQNRSMFIKLVEENPYHLYRDFASWFRLIDPGLADPAGKHKENIENVIIASINQAQEFHMNILKDYYHPKTFVFYGNDTTKLSFGTFRWKYGGTGINLSDPEIKKAKLKFYLPDGSRRIELPNGALLDVKPSSQDMPGDGTVPAQSGYGPTGKVAKIFATKGYSHQGSYSNSDMLALTQHLIAKLMQEI